MEPGGSPLLLAPPTTPWIASKFLGTAESLCSPLSSLETAYLAHLMVFPISPPGVSPAEPLLWAPWSTTLSVSALATLSPKAGDYVLTPSLRGRKEGPGSPILHTDFTPGSI